MDGKKGWVEEGENGGEEKGEERKGREGVRQQGSVPEILAFGKWNLRIRSSRPA